MTIRCCNGRRPEPRGCRRVSAAAPAGAGVSGFQARLAALGLGAAFTGAPPQACPEEVEGCSYEERMLEIASALTLPLYGPDDQTLPLEIPMLLGDMLVIHSDFAAHRRCRELLDSLLAHLRSVTAD